MVGCATSCGPNSYNTGQGLIKRGQRTWQIQKRVGDDSYVFFGTI
jgi:hypothetical protein